MGYLKIICNSPGIHKMVENFLCLAVGNGKLPTSAWWDYNDSDREFTVMGINSQEANRVINYIYDKSPEFYKSDLRFRLIGFNNDEFSKPKNEWEALSYMLQSFPKRKRVKKDELEPWHDTTE